MASLESSLLKAGRGNADLSEWHLAYFAYKDEGDMLTGFTPDSRGPTQTRYLTRAESPDVGSHPFKMDRSRE